MAALEALVALRAMAPGRIEPHLLSASEHFTYRPLQVGEPFGLGRAHRYALPELAPALGARFVHDAVSGVDPEARAVTMAGGGELGYDVLVVAVGARAHPAFEHGVSFDRETSPDDVDDMLHDIADQLAPRVAVVVPDGVTWPLPAYELALLTAAWAPPGTAVTLVTHEPAPLALFGSAASAAVARALDEGGVSVRCGVHADVVTPTALRAGGAWLEADRIIALPRLSGPHVHGLPADAHGFLPVDAHGRVAGVEDVYAAGDGTTVSIKQGGLAAQQAEAVAVQLAVRSGADTSVKPLRSVLRGVLRTRGGPLYLRAELHDPEGTSTASDQPLWWPPSKIASRWLAPHLARLDAEAQSVGTFPSPRVVR
ncbi:MAG: FAD-dependent oxidoreductase [Solirubrobacterales bacterium]|nr:FAD-dependent oxidoreductase [Solirubrobacterales bacterium]